MKGIIKTDRRYTLGEYKYATMEDTVELDENTLVLKPELTSQIRFLQLLGFEIAYRKYIKLVSAFPHNMDIEKALEQLEALRTAEIKKLKIILNGKSIEDTPLKETKNE